VSTAFRSATRRVPWLDEPLRSPVHLRLAAPGEAGEWPAWTTPRETAAETQWYRIDWAWADPRSEQDEPKPVRGNPWDAFLALGDLPIDDFPRRALSFAKRWGVLMLCPEHGLPASHAATCAAIVYLPDWQGSESLLRWLIYVKWARSIMRAAASLHQGVALTSEHLEELRLDGAFAPREDDIDGQRWALAWLVNRWLQVANVRPILTWGKFPLIGTGDRSAPPRVRLSHGGSIFGVLAVQLATSAAAREPRAEIETCHQCGEPVVRRRRSRSNFRVFCDKPACRRARARLNKRDQRAGLYRWRHSKNERGG
jgi:hypothetical protein